MSATAREIVAQYLATKAESTKPDRERELAAEAATAIVDELPDGFTLKDVRACVATFAEHDADLGSMTASRRNRAITKTLDGLVADGALKLDGDKYAHVFTGARGV
jgi:hypothetical protein